MEREADYVVNNFTKIILRKTKEAVVGVFFGLASAGINHGIYTLAERYFSFPYTSLMNPNTIEMNKVTNVKFRLVLLGATVLGPIHEEIYCRGLFQSLILRNSLHALTNRISPTSNISKDHINLKVARVFIGSIAFSSIHLFNLYISKNKSLIFMQLISTFATGLIYGTAMETMGSVSAITAHSVSNSLAYANIFRKK